MTDFRPDCIINLHVDSQGKPAKAAWSCSITHAKRGRIVLAHRLLGVVSREEAELKALLFGLRQCARLQQEKVELRSNFPLEGRLEQYGKGRRLDPELKLLKDEADRLWNGFRLRKTGKLDGTDALTLREEAEKRYRRGND